MEAVLLRARLKLGIFLCLHGLMPPFRDFCSMLVKIPEKGVTPMPLPTMIDF